MASMNDIKARMKSVTGTMQITKAMELVASSKLRRAKLGAESSRPYLAVSSHAVRSLLSLSEAADSPYLKRGVGPTLYLVIAGDRGLAGGYNANVFRLTAALAQSTPEAVYLPIGKKAQEHYRHRGCTPWSEAYPEVAEIGVGACMTLGHDICRAYAEGHLESVVLVYTEFTSMMTQTPKSATLLPLSMPDEPIPECEPLEDVEELMERVLPSYLGGLIHQAVCESLAAESGARRTAMNAASNNAKEMMDTLILRYNQARQAVITQEITEIVSGAEAL